MARRILKISMSQSKDFGADLKDVFVARRMTGSPDFNKSDITEIE
jgi:hypothetical protein